jgi:SAM-dependent MidA family methyltransferase
VLPLDPLRCGRLVALDYGLDAAAWGLPARQHGTLRAYHKHRRTDALLERPGEQDLTLHVNWDLVRSAGEDEGLTTALHLPQGRWLSSVLARQTTANPGTTNWSPAELRQFHTLTHPTQMGARFQVLVQARDRANQAPCPR